MSLQFIMGPSGAGKSHYLYEHVTNEAFKHPEKKYFVLVPEQFTMQTQKDLIMASPQKGILNIEVLSFNRLAHRIFEETGARAGIILDDTGKNLVIRKVAGECEDNLRVLGSNLRKPGYISEMKSMISEFTQYDLGPEDLDDLIEQSKGELNLYYKLQDMRVVYEAFRNFLEEKYITGEEVLDVLAATVPRSKLLEGSVIVLDGFTGFTPIQSKLLRQLLRVCERMMVTVTMDSRENPFVYQHPYQLFALSKQMVTGLVKIANDIQVSMLEPIYLHERPAYRFRESEPLAFLESHCFRYTKESYEKEQDNIQIWCARQPKDEVDFVARTIRRLVRTKNYRYRDIAVLTNDISAYANHIEQVFPTYSLPVFMDHKRSILLNSLAEYLRSLLAMAEQNFTYESVFRYLRTGLTCLSESEVDILENYVIALGIRGYKKWQEKWIRRVGHMEEEELSEINRIRLQFMSSIEDVMTVLKSRNKTVLDVTKALHTFFLKEELQKRAKEYQTRFEREGELALEKEYAQVYRVMIELMDQFVELLGDERISLKEYADLLDAGLEEAEVGIIPPSIDQVMVGDVERSRIKDVKVVFLLGVNDIYIPGAAAGKGLLTEYDRQRLTEHGAVLAPNAKEKTYIQKFYLYLALTKPSHQVYLTYSKSSAEGTSLRPSYLISDLLRLFSCMQVQETECAFSEQELTKESGIQFFIDGLRKKEEGLTPEWKELFTWYQKNPDLRVKIAKILEAAFYKKRETALSRETAKRLYGEILENSVTRLEKFAACAYAHFLLYGLELKERQEYRFQAVDLGNLFHSAIEKFSGKLEKEGYSWTSIPEEKKEAWIRGSVEECITDYGNSILYSSARNEYVIQRLTRMLRRSIWALTKQLEKGKFVPEGYEISFGAYPGLSASDIPLPGLGRMRLRGKIDRVDVYETPDHLYVKVIDYKTGEKAFDLGELYYGIQMQLVVYMNAAVEMQQRKHPNKQVIPAALFYYQMKDPIISRPGDDAQLEGSILKELRPDGIVEQSDAVLDALDVGFTGTSQVIPVAKTSSGGLSKTSKVLSEEEFAVISDFARHQVKQVGTQILEGKIDAMPYDLGGHTGCDYCPYRAICGFDERIPGCEYRKLEKLDRDDALEQMRGEV